MPKSTSNRDQQCPRCLKWYFNVIHHWSSPFSGRCQGYTPRVQAQRRNSSSIAHDFAEIEPEIESSVDLNDLDAADGPLSHEVYQTQASLTYGNVGVKWHEQLAIECDPTNPYYPFANKSEWEFASWSVKCGLTLSDVDSFLKLGLVMRSIYNIIDLRADTYAN
jgi:hypothetical protein